MSEALLFSQDINDFSASDIKGKKIQAKYAENLGAGEFVTLTDNWNGPSTSFSVSRTAYLLSNNQILVQDQGYPNNDKYLSLLELDSNGSINIVSHEFFTRYDGAFSNMIKLDDNNYLWCRRTNYSDEPANFSNGGTYAKVSRGILDINAHSFTISSPEILITSDLTQEDFSLFPLGNEYYLFTQTGHGTKNLCICYLDWNKGTATLGNQEYYNYGSYGSMEDIWIDGNTINILWSYNSSGGGSSEILYLHQYTYSNTTLEYKSQYMLASDIYSKYLYTIYHDTNSIIFLWNTTHSSAPDYEQNWTMQKFSITDQKLTTLKNYNELNLSNFAMPVFDENNNLLYIYDTATLYSIDSSYNITLLKSYSFNEPDNGTHSGFPIFTQMINNCILYNESSNSTTPRGYYSYNLLLPKCKKINNTTIDGITIKSNITNTINDIIIPE
jgi:hypothetical protein